MNITLLRRSTLENEIQEIHEVYSHLHNMCEYSHMSDCKSSEQQKLTNLQDGSMSDAMVINSGMHCLGPNDLFIGKKLFITISAAFGMFMAKV